MPDTGQVTAPPTEVWTYTGRRLTAKGQLTHAWVDLNPGGNTRRHAFRKQIVATARVGASYRFSLDPDDANSIFVRGEHGPRLVERPAWVTDDKVVGWAAEDQAAVIEQHRLTREKRANSELPDLHTVLLPVKVVYHRQRTRQAKAAVLAAVLAELERW